jgi:acyl-CoA thioester hydrolase
MMEKLNDYPVVVEIPIAWGDMDAMGHVNNTTYLKYFETGRIFYFGKMLIGQMMEKYKLGPILASQTCYYKAALRFPDKIFVGVKVSKLEVDSFTMSFIIISDTTKRIAAEGEGNHAFYNYKEKKRVNLPDRLVRRIKRIEKSRKWVL